MNQDSTVLSVYTSRTKADSAIKALAAHGSDMRQLSIVGKGCHSEDHAVGFYTAGNRIKTWGAAGAF